VLITPITGPATATVYSFDSLNRLETVTDHNNQVTSYGADAVGNRASISYPNGTSTTYAYDSLNRLTRIAHFGPTGALLKEYTHTLHATGRRERIEEATGRSTQYAYDDLYRLTGETITDATNGDYSAAYSYDEVGNRIQSIIDGVTTAYSYDANDRLTQQGGVTYSYDNQGNTLTEAEDSLTTKAYSYNSQQEVVQVITDDGTAQTTTAFNYGPDGIRTGKEEGGNATHFTIDHNRDYAQVLREDTPTDSVLYTYGDDLLSQDRSGNSTANFYLYDGLGSTRALADSSGALTDTYDYEAFGTLLKSDGLTDNDYRYTGEQFDTPLSQYYLRARYYNQGIGRFTQMDTFQGVAVDPVTLHKYLYAGNDPVLMVDPGGELFGFTGNLSVSVQVALYQASALVAPASIILQRFRLSFLNSSAIQNLINAGRLVRNNPITQQAIQQIIGRANSSSISLWTNGIKGAQKHYFQRILSQPERFIEIAQRLQVAEFRLGAGGFERFTRIAQEIARGSTSYGQRFLSSNGNAIFVRTRIVDGTGIKVGSQDIGVVVVRNSNGLLQPFREAAGHVVRTQ